MKSKIPRGIRNNNPLNIRIGLNWIGEASPNTDGAFEQFQEMKWGVRAACIIIRTYITKYKLNTVEKIIRRWAPDSENNTEAYINAVCERAVFSRNKRIDITVVSDMTALIAAMAFYENGVEISMNDILDGYYLSLGYNKKI